jgi:TPR repeat protein
VEDAAEQSTEAKYTLAQSLLKGENGLAVNPTLAMKYLLELAGVQVNMEKFDPAYEEMETITENENGATAIAAMRQLASCYLHGNGVEIDQNTGLAWLQQAYRHGDLDCAHVTAVIYEYGKYGVEVDIYLAAKWFHGAARAGNVESMAEYAMCLELGCGVEQSDEEALDWYQKAAELGDATSNYSVGEWFESARGGLPQSDTEAVLWYFKAASMGDEDSKMALKRLNAIARIIVPGWASTLNV